MMRSACAILCLVVAAASLQQGEARPARALLQTASSFSEADAAAWVTANLTGSPNVQAASSAVAQAASMAISSGSTSSSALASAFVSVLLNADSAIGNATAEAYAQALTNTIDDSNSQQVIAQAYSSAILSLYQANQIEVHLTFQKLWALAPQLSIKLCTCMICLTKHNLCVPCRQLPLQ